jgi:formylglycine-generating enzyme required for sulfatase activity
MPVASSGGEVIGVGDPDAGFEKVALHEPLPGFTIDRLFELSAPDQGIARVRVDLSGACLGVPTQPKTGSETCLVNPHDGIAYVGTANEGVVALSDPLQSADSRVGSWEGAKEVDCRGSPRAGTGLHEEEVCIKGGAFFLGDERMESAGCSPACATIPERLVVLSPFFMDKYEVSVGRWRVAIEKGFSTKNPWLAEKNYKYCKYRPDGVNDDWPMNCVSWEAATDFCAYDGGRLLPSEAQWEYAASGRGREWMYVWGNDLVECWRSVFARVGASLGYPQPAQFGTFLECKDMGEGPAKVGALSGVGQDATRDGVVDMNGNLREWTRDETQSYNLGCWAKPMDKDPTCADGLKFQWSDSTIQPFHTVRGGCWGGGSGMMAVAWRAPILLGESGQKEHFTFWGGEAPFLGFRCVRETKAGGT